MTAVIEGNLAETWLARSPLAVAKNKSMVSAIVNLISNKKLPSPLYYAAK